MWFLPLGRGAVSLPYVHLTTAGMIPSKRLTHRHIVECPTTGQPKVYGLFRLPLHCPLGQTFHSLRLCRQPFCDACNEAPDVATLHTECFNVFMQKCTAADKLERLASFVTWREPWHTGPSLGLRPRLDIKRAMHLAADLCDMQRLCSVPLEIAEMIQRLSESAVFWRYASVMELVDRASTTWNTEKQALTSYDIAEIDSWERGFSPILTRGSHSSSLNTVIRIKIDSCGISSIERLVEAPSPSNSRSDSFAYIVETEHSLRNTTVSFKVCLTLYVSQLLVFSNMASLDFVALFPFRESIYSIFGISHAHKDRSIVFSTALPNYQSNRGFVN